jgi:hypothetical protein
MTLTLTNRVGEIKVKVTSTTRITKDRQPAVFGDAKEGLMVFGSGKKLEDGSWEASAIRITTPPPRRTDPPATPPPSGTEQK